MSGGPSVGAGVPPGGLEVRLGRVLQIGTYVSIALVALGTLLLLASGGSPLTGGPALSPADVLADVAALRPAGFLWLGIIGVLVTPALRVFRALIGFWRRGEVQMAAVAGLILAVVAIGVFAGLLTG